MPKMPQSWVTQANYLRHFAYDCPEPEECKNCFQTGHYASECKNERVFIVLPCSVAETVKSQDMYQEIATQEIENDEDKEICFYYH